MSTKYQTLSEFMFSPFNNKDAEKDDKYEAMYKDYILKNKIRVYAMCIIEGSYFIHIKVPSESQKNGKYEYDVVIRFFTDSPETMKDTHLRNYYIQFFSNSPSFMYQYAYLYKKEGYLINALYNKLDADYANKPPEKTNPNMHASYDKSIFFACRYLADRQFRYLDKRGHILSKKLDQKKFFSNISDFKSVRLDQSLLAEEKKLQNIIKDKAPRSVLAKAKASLSTNKVEASINSSKHKHTTVYGKRVEAKGKISGNNKKTSSKTTRKK